MLVPVDSGVSELTVGANLLAVLVKETNGTGIISTLRPAKNADAPAGVNPSYICFAKSGNDAAHELLQNELAAMALAATGRYACVVYVKTLVKMKLMPMPNTTVPRMERSNAPMDTW